MGRVRRWLGGETPDDIRTRAFALHREGRTDAAARRLRRGIERFPQDPGLRVHLAFDLMVREPDEARSLIDDALALGANDPIVVISCGEALLGLHDFEAAARTLAMASAFTPDLEQSGRLASRLLHLSAELAWWRGDGEKAERDFRGAYEIEPTVIGNGERLSRFLADDGRLTEALDVIEDSLRHLRDDPALIRAREDFRGRITAGIVASRDDDDYGKIVALEAAGDEASVVVDGRNGHRVTLRFTGVRSFQHQRAVGMVFYGFVALEAEPPLRRFVFEPAEDQPEFSRVEVLAREFTVDETPSE